MIPTDAAFIFALNDNDAFVTGSASLTPYLNELFVLDAMPAYQTMRSKLPNGEDGEPNDPRTAFACVISHVWVKRLKGYTVTRLM